MSDATRGYTYWVSDEQIAAYRSLPIDRRVRWLEETARLTWSLASPEVRARWAALRAGRSIEAPAETETETAPATDLSRPTPR